MVLKQTVSSDRAAKKTRRRILLYCLKNAVHPGNYLDLGSELLHPRLFGSKLVLFLHTQLDLLLENLLDVKLRELIVLDRFKLGVLLNDVDQHV